MPFDFDTRDGGVGAADAGEHEFEVFVDFGRGAYGGTGVAAVNFLFDGNGRGDIFDEVYVGLCHAAEELAGIGGETFNIAALAFGIEGVEGET